MGARRMKCIVNGRILLKDGILDGKALAFERSIGAIADRPPEGAEIIDARGGWVTPGLIDVHCHGYKGLDASRGSAEDIRQLSEEKLKQGVTAWLPTTMTLPWPALERCFAVIREAQRESRQPGWRGAEVRGAHAEGPFISPAKKGAQDGASIQRPDIDKLRPWSDVVRLMTVAPEVDGALEFIRQAREIGVALSMGHTNATAAQAAAGIEAGIRHVTHTFNAMPPLNHREPGVIGAALSDDRVYCELICDTFHVSPMLFSVMARLKPEHLVLITDSIQAAGLPDGEHDQLGVKVIVDGIRCRFPDGTIAGSALTLDRAVRNLLRNADVPVWRAVNMASLIPARAIGVDDRKGSIEAGKDADLVLMDEGFHVVSTFVGGERRY